MAEFACLSPIFTCFIDVPSFVCVDPKYLKWSTSSSVLHSSIVLLDCLGLILLTILLLLELMSAVSSSCFHQSLSELLEIFFTVNQQIDDVGKPKVADWLSSDGHRRQWDVTFFYTFYIA